MAEWLRLRAFEENGLNIRRIRGGSNPAAKKFIGWAVGAEVTSCRHYGRRKPNYNGLNIRRIRRGSNPAAKKSMGWAVGAEVTSLRYYGRRKPNF